SRRQEHETVSTAEVGTPVMELRARGWLCAIAMVAMSLGLPTSGAYAQSDAASKSKYALLIGIWSYEKSQLDSLEGAANDIRLMAEVLKTSFGVPAANTTVILDEAATHTRIQGAFEDLARKVRP